MKQSTRQMNAILKMNLFLLLAFATVNSQECFLNYHNFSVSGRIDTVYNALNLRSVLNQVVLQGENVISPTTYPYKRTALRGKDPSSIKFNRSLQLAEENRLYEKNRSDTRAMRLYYLSNKNIQPFQMISP